ncbi:MAG: ABC transporter substrate-binding protein [Chloroflexi bacterium]|nr:ABC transporter substrate-binding protein [Chloroflexota bacterium]
MRSFKRYLLALTAVAVLGAVFSAACGGDDDDGGSATTAASPTSAASPAASATAAAYPVKVTDLFGRSVEIKARPAAVVALSPSAVEFVYAAGGTVIGRPTSANFPAEAKSAKEVGTSYQPNFETILSLKPDLLVADSVIHADPQVRKSIESLGIAVVFVGADSYSQVTAGLKLMGQVFDSTKTTDAVVAKITKARDDAKARIAKAPRSAVVLIGDKDQTLYAAKPSGYVGSILAELGVTNPASALPDSGPFPGYATIAPEKLIQFNPDYILTITPAPAPAPRLSALVPQVPPFKGLKAVTSSHVVEIDVEIFLQAPGPRLEKALTAIADAVGAP